MLNNSVVVGIAVIGTLAGMNNNSVLNNIQVNNVKINATQHFIGGVVGLDRGKITNSNANGEIFGNSQGIGGLVGATSIDSIIDKSYSNVSIHGGTNGFRRGGLVGDHSGVIKNSYSTGNVDTLASSVGGFVGHSNGGSIINSYSTGNVSSKNNTAGGFVGANSYLYTKEVKDRKSGRIEYSFSIGNAKGADYVGGFVGYNAGGVVKYSRASGSYSSNGTYKGALFGRDMDSGVSGSYENHTYRREVVNVLKYSYSQMNQASIYTNWDFENTWEIKSGAKYPTLQWQK